MKGSLNLNDKTTSVVKKYISPHCRVEWRLMHGCDWFHGLPSGALAIGGLPPYTSGAGLSSFLFSGQGKCINVQWRSRGYCRLGPNIYGRPCWCSRNTFASEIAAPVKVPPPPPFAPPLLTCIDPYWFRHGCLRPCSSSHHHRLGMTLQRFFKR